MSYGTAPSICRGHPVGICDSSRSPSPFCLIISPSIGTSIEVLRLIRGRLHRHVSGESKPRLASSATAGKEGWSLMINASSLIMSRRPCMGSGIPCPELGGGSLVAVVSWNQMGRTDLTPVTLFESVLLMLSRRRLWYIGGIIHAGTKMTTYWTFHATWRSWFLKSGVMHRTCPSMTRTYDSVRSKEAVTLRLKYSSLNQYSLSNMNERCGDLVSRTCLAGAKSATSHSARNSMTLFSSLGRAFWTAWNADSMFGVCEAEGVPSVCLM